jgi:hypothetical protein
MKERLLMSRSDEMISEVAEAWLVTTRNGRNSKVVAILGSTLTSAEMCIIVDQIYRAQYLTPMEQLMALEEGKTFTGFTYLNDGTIDDQKIGNDCLHACHAYEVQIWLRTNETLYLRWRQKDVLREWDPEKQEFWTSEWWEEGLTLELDSALKFQK